jgi:pyrroline-5-carboxylate reductase
MAKLNMLSRIGVVGLGNMGSIIAGRLAKIPKEYSVIAYDKDKKKNKDIGLVKIVEDLSLLANDSDIIIIAVKPQDIGGLLKELSNLTDNKIIISIVAGISTKYIEKFLDKARVIRSMPNIAVKIGESVTCISKGASACEDDLDFAKEIFASFGGVLCIEEEMMDAATAISGSGPGYVFYFIESSGIDYKNMPEAPKQGLIKRLEKSAQVLGFNKEDATFLAVNTVNASILLLKETDLSPEELRAQVSSKGGTTEAGLKVLSKGGSWEEAALAALKRARELSGKE